jgi:hypothetical protein
MHRVTFVSFPRSGHHLVMTGLGRYFGADRDFYSNAADAGGPVSTFQSGPLRYCEYYTHCRSVPCANPETNMQKNHDLSLRLPLESGRFLVLHRAPEPAIASWYRVVHSTSLFWRFLPRFASSALFRKLKYLYWKGFMEKWVRPSHPVDRFLILRYEDILRQPMEVFRSIIRFCDDSGDDINEEKLRLVTDSLGLPRTP